MCENCLQKFPKMLLYNDLVMTPNGRVGEREEKWHVSLRVCDKKRSRAL